MTADGRTGGRADCNRREFFGLLAGALLLSARSPATAQSPDSLPGTGPAGRLWDPSRAGRPLPPVTARDNDAAIQAIEKQIRCTCGCNQDVYTCRTTDFNCTTSPAMHRRVLELADAGKSGPEIVDQFVREHGVAVLMAPPKRGFNLAAYFLPSAALVAAGTVLVVVLRRWTRAASAAAPPVAVSSPAASREELERLRQEVERLPE